jgi:signal transduction histidine kinase
LAQGLVGVSVQLEIVSRLLTTSAEGAREHLDQARVLVRESIADARRSIWQLRSESAETEDLAARLSQAAGKTASLNRIALKMEVKGTYRPLNKKVEDELLRIGQEAVMNAAKHANCEQLNIELVYGQQRLIMSIKDDGCGFDPDGGRPNLAGHFGLKGMQERADQIKAKLRVTSEPGQGTLIVVDTPLS